MDESTSSNIGGSFNPIITARELPILLAAQANVGRHCARTRKV